MPWRQPPPEIAGLVAQNMGDQLWMDLEARWLRVLAVDPAARLTQWYRTPAEVRKEYLGPSRGAWLTQHGLGLAVDVTPTAARRAAFLAAARREGFTLQTYARDKHVHLQALSREAWSRSPLRALLGRMLGPAPAR